MRRLKTFLWVVLAFLVGSSVGWLAHSPVAQPTVPAIPKEKCPALPNWISAENLAASYDVPVLLDGVVSRLQIQSYLSPFPVTRPLLETAAQINLSTPEDAHISQLSADNRDWLLRCFDLDAQAKLKATAERRKGKYFDYLKTVRQLPWPSTDPKAYVLRAFLARGGREYCFLKLESVDAHDNFVLTFVRTDGCWLRTFTWDGSALLGLITETTPAAFAQLAQAGTVVAPQPTTVNVQTPDGDAE